MQDQGKVATGHSPALRRFVERFAPLLVMCLAMRVVQGSLGWWAGIGVGVAAALAVAAVLHVVGRLVDRREARRHGGRARSRVGAPGNRR